MKLRAARIILASAAAGALAAGSGTVLAQQGPVTRNFDAEILAALQSAKTAAGFEFARHPGPDVSVASERRRRHPRQSCPAT